jgi:quinol monooxygenase YgiN
MMILVAGTISVDPKQIDAMDRAAKAMVGGVRKEDGCIHYSLLVEDRAAGLINVLEMWRDEDALRVHLKLPTIVEFFNRFSPHITGMTVQVYDAENARPVPMG